MILKNFHKISNAGDAIAPILAKQYFSEKITLEGSRALTESNLILVGSILQWADEMSHICGAGLLSPTAVPTSKPKTNYLVRGPLTRHFLEQKGIACNGLYGDPGALAPVIFPNQAISNSYQYKIGIIPHYVDKDTDWIRQQARDKNLLVIDICSPLSSFFDQLMACDVILSSSLHGIIFAHAYGKKALWIELSNKILGNGFKFYDYYLSTGISPENVIRLRINDKHNPYDIANMAAFANQERLIDDILEGINLTKDAMIQISQ